MYGQNEDGEEDGRSENEPPRFTSAESAGIAGDAARVVPPGTLRRRSALARAPAPKTAGLENADASTLDLGGMRRRGRVRSRRAGSGSSQKASRSHGDAQNRSPTFAVLAAASAARNNPETLAALARGRRRRGGVPAGARLRLALIGTEAEATAAAANGANGASAFAEGSDVASLRVAAVDRDGAWGARRANAVLARPDGHVAWIGAWGGGRRTSNASCVARWGATRQRDRRDGISIFNVF